jgi:hypothetical protein
MSACMPFCIACGHHRIAALLVCVLVGGCSLGQQIKATVEDYHSIYGDSGDTVVLSNIVRASEGLPLHFSILSKINGTLSAAFQVSVTPQFGPGVSTRSTTTPQITVSSNPNFEVDNLETQNFVTGILTPLDPAKFRYFLESGLDYRAAMMLLVSGVRLAGNPVILNSPDSPRWVCYPGGPLTKENRPIPGHVYAHYIIAPSPDGCAGGEPEIFAFLRIVNGLTPFFAHEFQQAEPIGPPLPAATVLKTDIDKLADLEKSQAALLPVEGGRKFQLVNLHQRMVLCETEPEKQGLGLLHSPDDPECQESTHPLLGERSNNLGRLLEVKTGVNLRSVAGMFDYVGQVVAWERERQRCLTVDFSGRPDADNCRGNVFFQLVEPPARAIFSVSYRGKSYGVGPATACVPGKPGGSTGRAGCDYSTQVMNVLALSLGLNIQAKDLPQTPLLQLLP